MCCALHNSFVPFLKENFFLYKFLVKRDATFRGMGKKNQARKGRSGAPQGGGAVDSLSADLSDLFKTLPPIKRADLTKTVEKLFQVIRESKRPKPL